jgi:hypothetical protein
MGVRGSFTYRAERRAAAKKAKLDWRKLPRAVQSKKQNFQQVALPVSAITNAK